MTCPNPLNIYNGPDSVEKYFDPDFQPPLPLVELPSKLNPFRSDSVRIYAKMMTALPAQNIKALPALNMLQDAGTKARRTIIEPSSGSTVISLALIARALYQNSDVHAYVSNKTEESRLRTLQFFGLKVSLYGGPSQPEISDSRGQIAKARRLAEENDGIFNPGQYENDSNPAAHMRWTGPQLLRQLPEINVFCAGMGSAGCITGTGIYLKQYKPLVTVVGVCNATGDSIPGPRPYPLFSSIKFPWRDAVDTVKEISSVDSYRLSMSLSREGLICGPSSGMALQGLFDFLQEMKDENRLHELAEATSGDISCVFPCCDLPYQYLDGYFKRLGEHEFHPITNRNLLSVDTDIYDVNWELDQDDAMTVFFGKDWSGDIKSKMCSKRTSKKCLCSPKPAVLLDLRLSEDFDIAHISGSTSSPLRSLSSVTASPFDDVDVLERQWRDLKGTLDGNEVSCGGTSGPIVVVCYQGETARLACSVLRGQGKETYSLRGGMAAVLMGFQNENSPNRLA